MHSEKDSPKVFDVLVAGGGLVGLSMAVSLARTGLQVAVVEREPFSRQLQETFDGRVSAIALSSKNLLEHIGVWQHMAPHAEPINDIRVSDGHAPVFLHFDHKEIGDVPFGWIVENRYTRHALVKAAEEVGNITVFSKDSIVGFDSDTSGVNATLRSGKTIRGRLLVGADGKNSRIRRLAKIRTISSNYEQTAIVCTISHSESHQGLAQERFLPAGPFAVLPMQDHCSSLVWTEPDDRAAYYLMLSEEDFVEEITERVGDYLGKIELEGERFSYPLSYSLATSYVAPRVVLIGDAAHAIHPIAGQGVNLGFRDVAVLAELFDQRAKLGMDFAAVDVLEHYQRWRRFDNLTMLGVTDGLNHLFSNRNPLMQAARGAGLYAVSHVPPLKRFFMRHAMGITGDVPALMKAAA